MHVVHVVRRLGDRHSIQKISLKLLKNSGGIGVLDQRSKNVEGRFTSFWEKIRWMDAYKVKADEMSDFLAAVQ